MKVKKNEVSCKKRKNIINTRNEKKVGKASTSKMQQIDSENVPPDDYNQKFSGDKRNNSKQSNHKRNVSIF